MLLNMTVVGSTIKKFHFCFIATPDRSKTIYIYFSVHYLSIQPDKFNTLYIYLSVHLQRIYEMTAVKPVILNYT